MKTSGQIPRAFASSWADGLAVSRLPKLRVRTHPATTHLPINLFAIQLPFIRYLVGVS